ncbi:hypothetical protein NAP1_11078 [Erythrobacter sp. NAP1]|uniref:DUF4136 domain-containing protein n=1 Tax=Erythrobacter sp. NAP1 TaxID=237727 RepID=UPI0000687734|nr:DUF4136 domain-containing protein [Erythrobacter sp. NAP1]EAQ28133.1 hypothetical protein NAP1_11078 [Erythrobacter sp. NAP1]
MNRIAMSSRSNRFSRLSRLALAGIATATLAACAPSFKADVSRFQAQLPAPQGQTFAVVAEDPTLAGGLEFALYADMVAAEMAELGYNRAATPESANLLVRFDYGVDNGRERIRSNGLAGDPFFGPWGGFGGFGFRRAYAFGFYDPFLAGPQVRSYTVYTSDIDLKIDNTATGERLFEGSAQAVSRSNRLQSLVPNLVDAIFTDFPGSNGETLRITIKEDGKTVRPAR